MENIKIEMDSLQATLKETFVLWFFFLKDTLNI
jgi:hypothetical protein